MKIYTIILIIYITLNCSTCSNYYDYFDIPLSHKHTTATIMPLMEIHVSLLMAIHVSLIAIYISFKANCVGVKGQSLGFRVQDGNICFSYQWRYTPLLIIAIYVSLKANRVGFEGQNFCKRIDVPIQNQAFGDIYIYIYIYIYI